MQMALVILLAVSALLFIASFAKMKKQSKDDQKQIDTYYAVMLDETNQLKEQIRKLEMDGEITAQEAGVMSFNSEERNTMRKMLDLYKRGYSIKSISAQTKLTEQEVEEILAPYESGRNRGRKLANDA
jgi:hypothetical protein